jgi:hypothetical protein
MQDLELRFTDQEISSWGGVSLLKKMLYSSGFMDILGRLPLPLQGSNRGYAPLQLLVQLWFPFGVAPVATPSWMLPILITASNAFSVGIVCLNTRLFSVISTSFIWNLP